jgi:hypothetical protein
MKTIAIFVILSAIVTAIVAVSTSTAALADKPSKTGLERADDNVHEHAIQNDVKFHEGTCQGGHSTTALGPSGCDNPILSDPGNSDRHRQDK